MQHIGDGMKRRLAQKKLTKQAIGSYLLFLIKEKVVYATQLRVKLQGVILTIILDSREDKTKRFHQRIALKDELNEKLKTLGYDLKIETIRIQ